MQNYFSMFGGCFFFNIQRRTVPFEYVLRTYYYKTAWRIWEIAYLAIFNKTIFNCKLGFCSEKNRSPAIMWNVAVSPFWKDLMFEYHDSKYMVTATLFCVSFEIWNMITECEHFGEQCPTSSSVEHPLWLWWGSSACEALKGESDPFLLIPHVRNVKLHDRFGAPPHRIVFLLYISLISVKLHQEVWVTLHSYYHFQSVWKYARPDTYLVLSLFPFPEQNEAKLASRIPWSNSRAHINEKRAST